MNNYEIREKGKFICSGTATECSEKLRISRSAFYTLVYQNTDAKKPKYSIVKTNCSRGKNKASNYYTVVKRETSEIVAAGNAEECAKQLNFSVHSFYSMVARVKNGINQKYEVQVMRRNYE